MSEQKLTTPLPPDQWEAFRQCLEQMPPWDIAHLFERDPAFLEYVRARR